MITSLVYFLDKYSPNIRTQNFIKYGQSNIKAHVTNIQVSKQIFSQELIINNYVHRTCIWVSVREMYITYQLKSYLCAPLILRKRPDFAELKEWLCNPTRAHGLQSLKQNVRDFPYSTRDHLNALYHHRRPIDIGAHRAFQRICLNPRKTKLNTADLLFQCTYKDTNKTTPHLHIKW